MNIDIFTKDKADEISPAGIIAMIDEPESSLIVSAIGNEEHQRFGNVYRKTQVSVYGFDGPSVSLLVSHLVQIIRSYCVVDMCTTPDEILDRLNKHVNTNKLKRRTDEN